jgi:tetratricopeptide (TPR) repeat protein
VSPAGYSTAETAGLVGLPPPRVRALARAGVAGRKVARGYRFSFQDLVVLRSARALLADGVPMARVRRALAALREQLPVGRSLTAVRLAVEAGRVVVSDGERLWEPTSGQAVLGFAVAELAREAAPLAPRLAREAAPPGRELAADQLFELALELEATSSEEAQGLYRRALEADPAHAEAHLNLGRLLHEEGRLAEAEAAYRRALAAGAGDGLAAFNLGVALEDQERWREAGDAYREALAADPALADAWYNLAGIAERLGDRGEAMRCLLRYRDLRGLRRR